MRRLLCTVFILSLIHDCIGKIPKVKMIALGVDNVYAHFPQASDISAAIDFEWRRVEENDFTNYPFIACTSANIRIHEYFEERNLLYFTSLINLDRDLWCDTVYMNAGDVAAAAASEIAFELLVPIPEAFKLDISLIYALDWMNKANVTSNEKRGANEDKNSIYSHAIVRHLAAGDDVDLAVVYRPELSPIATTNLNQVDLWMNKVTQRSSVHHFEHCGVCLGSVYGESRALVGSGRAKSRHTRFPIHYSSKHKSRQRPTDHTAARWLHWADQWSSSEYNSAPGGIESICQMRQLKFTPRHDEFSVRLPSAMKTSAVCLSRLLSVLMSTPGVTKVAITLPKKTLNDNARGVVQSGLPMHEPFTKMGLTGHGVIIGQSDTGVDDKSCYFIDKVHGQTPRSTMEHPTVHMEQRKIVQYVNFSSNGDYLAGHGTHTAGILVANCEGKDNNGIASGAKLAFFDIGVSQSKGGDLVTPDDISQIFPSSHRIGAKLHSNSWGGGYWYDMYAHQVDRYLYANQDFLAIFAAGNQGRHGENTVLSPSLSKNALSVGATGAGHGNINDIGAIAYFSSQGPAPDGRFKPDIAGPGVSITSTQANAEEKNTETCATTMKSGTSMAAPAAAGAAAIIHEYFLTPSVWQKVCIRSQMTCRTDAFQPSGVLTKALLIHSGKAVSSPSTTPDIKQGFGRVQLDQILPLPNSTFQLFADEQSLYEGHQLKYDIMVLPEATNGLKVTLSWFDPPCTEFSAKVLIHDLDLVIVDPQGRMHFGNSPNSGQVLMGAQRDTLNNNEQVVIPNPVEGVWGVLVQAKALLKDSNQMFALVVTTDEINTVLAPDESFNVAKELLDRCHIGSGINPGYKAFENRTAIDVALFNFWAGEIQSTTRRFELSTYNDTMGLHPPVPASALHETDMELQDVYTFDTVCLPAGCYEAEMTWNRSIVRNPYPPDENFPPDMNPHIPSYSEAMGMLAFIPQCNAFFSPLLQKQEICLDERVVYRTVANGSSVASHELECHTSCQRKDHVLMDIALRQTLGEGWLGSYFTVHRTTEMDDKSGVGSDGGWRVAGEQAPFTGGTMEWGLEEARSICLPALERCYEVILWTQDNADVHYGNADPPSRTARDPDPYPSLIFNGDVESSSCTSRMQSNVSVARVCTDGFSHANVTFYATDLAKSNSSSLEVAGTSGDVMFYGEEVGRCENLQVSLQSAYPEAIQAMSREHSPTCLQSCFRSFSTDLFQRSLTVTCLVLGNAFGSDCGAVDVRSADPGCAGISATEPDCATGCSAADWCYFSALHAEVCPLQSEIANMDANQIDALHSHVSTLAESCHLQWQLNFPPTMAPTTDSPTLIPTSSDITMAPTSSPTPLPTSHSKSLSPVISPTKTPSKTPTLSPTKSHSTVIAPTTAPTKSPSHTSGGGSIAPTIAATQAPTKAPVNPMNGVNDDYDDDAGASSGKTPSLSGGGSNSNSLGGATSSTIAIAIVVVIGLLVALAFLVRKCRLTSFGLRNGHSLLHNSSDHGEEDDIVVFEDFHNSSVGSGRSLFSNFGGKRSHGLEMGNKFSNEDDDGIMEITL